MRRGGPFGVLLVLFVFSLLVQATDVRPLKGTLMSVARARLFSETDGSLALDPRVLLALHPVASAHLFEQGLEFASLARAPAATLKRVLDSAQMIVLNNRLDGGAVVAPVGSHTGASFDVTPWYYLVSQLIAPLFCRD
jgi:hypothetical protein